MPTTYFAQSLILELKGLVFVDEIGENSQEELIIILKEDYNLQRCKQKIESIIEESEDPTAKFTLRQNDFFSDAYKEDTFLDECQDCGTVGTDFETKSIDKESFVIICPKCGSQNCEPLKSFWKSNNES